MSIEKLTDEEVAELKKVLDIQFPDNTPMYEIENKAIKQWFYDLFTTACTRVAEAVREATVLSVDKHLSKMLAREANTPLDERKHGWNALLGVREFLKTL